MKSKTPNVNRFSLKIFERFISLNVLLTDNLLEIEFSGRRGKRGLLDG